MKTDYDEMFRDEIVELLEDARALAASRLEMLRKSIIETYYCPACKFELDEKDGLRHADGCELAEELAQAQADEYIESESAHIILELGDE